jgi:Protein of unknown function (DUF2380)
MARPTGQACRSSNPEPSPMCGKVLVEGNEAMRGSKAEARSEIVAHAACGWRWRQSLLAAGRAPLVAFGVAVFLIVASIAVAPRSTATAAPDDSVKSVALLNIEFLNDHADLEPTTNAERARLASTVSLFKAKLEASGRYRIVSIPTDTQAKIDAGPAIGSCGGCELGYGKELGADYAAWIVVQKVSDLILNINVYMADVATGKLAFVHSVDIRGDTDESWTRGLTYLLKNYLLVDQ